MLGSRRTAVGSVGAVTSGRRWRRSVPVAMVRIAVATAGLAARRPMRFHHWRKSSSAATLGANQKAGTSVEDTKTISMFSSSC